MSRLKGRRGMALALVVAALGGALATATPRTATAQVAGGCSNATLNGSYGYQASGAAFIGPDGVPQVGGARVDFAATGRVVFDGRGGFTFAETASIGGMVLPRGGNGTYTTQADCTGTATASFASGEVNELAVVIVHGGEEFYFMTTNPGTTLFATAKKQ